MAAFRGALVAALLFAGPSLAQTFPPLTGRVVDGADILSPATEADLAARLAALETATGVQLVVATVPSLQGYTIEDYGYRLGRAWGIGQADKDDGAIFLTAPNDREVRVEVGYGLQARLTDLMSGLILRQHVLPLFREGRMEAGVVAGTTALVQHLGLTPAEAQARAAQAEAQARAQPQRGGSDGVAGLVVTLLIFWLIASAFGAMGGGGRRGRGGGSGVLPIILWSLANSSSGHGRSGGWGGGGLGGGGFRGGGGSFGGGGASGSW